MNLNLPVNQAMDLIESAHFDWIDHIYGGSIPREVQDNVDSNDILITETENEPGKYSNNQFKKWKIGVEISIFYKKEIPADFNMMKAEIDLVKLFKAHRWALIQSKNHLIDPDTDQVSKVFYFDRSITLKEDK